MSSRKDSKCGVCATPHFERNNYFYGKQFTVRDLLQEQSYFNEKRRLVNRMVLGSGVVCGLGVRWDLKKRAFVVEAGMALDCCGREIVVCEPRPVPFDEYEEQCHHAREKAEHWGKFALCLEYDECHAEPVELPAIGCDDAERVEFNRVRDGYKLRLKKWEDACRRQPDDQTPCPAPFKHAAGAVPETPDCRTEDLHHYLCGRLGEGCPECDGCGCVVLATVYVRAARGWRQQPPEPPPYRYERADAAQQPGHEEQQPDGLIKDNRAAEYAQEAGREPLEVWLDTCTDRRLVYSNPLLYDLVYCHHGDLPHIVDFNWRRPAGPDRELDWETFVRTIKSGLTVYFDQEIEPKSLNIHTFIVSYLYRETGTKAFVVKRLPLKEIRMGRDGDCYTATFVARDQWIKDELETSDSELIADPRYERGVKVEITLRGSRIWSTRGKGLDGDYLADKLPTGNGTQGGDFVDWFRVLPPAARKPGEEQSYEDY